MRFHGLFGIICTFCAVLKSNSDKFGDRNRLSVGGGSDLHPLTSRDDHFYHGQSHKSHKTHHYLHNYHKPKVKKVCFTLKHFELVLLSVKTLKVLSVLNTQILYLILTYTVATYMTSLACLAAPRSVVLVQSPPPSTTTTTVRPLTEPTTTMSTTPFTLPTTPITLPPTTPPIVLIPCPPCFCGRKKRDKREENDEKETDLEILDVLEHGYCLERLVCEMRSGRKSKSVGKALKNKVAELVLRFLMSSRSAKHQRDIVKSLMQDEDGGISSNCDKLYCPNANVILDFLQI